MALSDAELEAAIAAVPAANPSVKLSDEDILKTIAATPAATPGKGEALLRGAAQGATMGFGDEIAGAYDALSSAPGQAIYEWRHPEDAKSASLGERYRQGRDEARAANEAAKKAHGNYYLGGELAASLAPALLTSGLGTGATAARAVGTAAKALAPRALALAAGQGAAQGLGYSNADTARGLAGDSLLGAGIGLAGHALGTAAGAAGSRLVGRAADKAAAATAKAGNQAAEEVAEALATAKGNLGSEVQKGSRYIENLMRLEQSMSPEQKALYSELQASGVIPDLQRAVAQNTLEALPSQAETIANRREFLEFAKQLAPYAKESRAADLLKPQIGKDAASFAKSYLEPAGAALVGGVTGIPHADAAMGLVFSKTRAAKALADRINRPGNQMAIANLLRGAGNATQYVGEGFQGGGRALIPATATLSALLRARNEE